MPSAYYAAPVHFIARTRILRLSLVVGLTQLDNQLSEPTSRCQLRMRPNQRRQRQQQQL